MSNAARETILNTLRRAQKRDMPLPIVPWQAPQLSYEERVELYCERCQKALVNVMRTHEENFVKTLSTIIENEEIKTLVHGRGMWFEQLLSQEISPTLTRVPYDDSIEKMKEQLFTVDAGIISTSAAIAENGTCVVRATPEEPRTLSLVPPIFIAVVKASTIYSTLTDVIKEQQWDSSLPTNTILISSPSRTADIELVLAVGVHGPKKMYVILVE